MNEIRKKSSGVGIVALFLVVSVWLLLIGCAGTKVAKQEEKAPMPPAASSDKQITAVSASDNGEGVIIRVTGDQLLTYTSVKQPSPSGVILYFPNTVFSSASIQTGAVEGGDVIDAVHLDPLTENGNTTRLAVILRQDVPYEVYREGQDLVISFAKAPAVPVVSQPSAEAPVESQAAAATQLLSVSSEASADQVGITIAADGQISDFKSFTIKNPARIVFDLYNISSASDKEQLVAVDTPWVKQVRHYGYPDRVRVVLDTEESFLSAYRAEAQSGGLNIFVGPGVSGSTEPAAETQASAPAATAGEPAWVNRIDFSGEADGKSVIIIGTTAPVNYEVKKAADNRLQMALFNTRLPDYRKRPLITTRFESAVDRITPIQPPDKAATSLIVVELRESVPYYVDQTDNLLMLHFEASTVAPKPVDMAQLPEWQQVIEEATAMPTSASEVAAAPAMMPEQPVQGTGQAGEPAAEETDLISGSGRHYIGEKIALDFFETDIKNVFRIIREISGKNFAVDKNVSGQVTLSLEKPVPWDQVLDLVLKMNQLGMTMEGDIIRIATQETLANERQIAQAKQAAEQETREKQKALEPLVTEYLPVNYANAETDVLPQIVTTPERGSATVDARNNQIIITDTPDMVKRAKQTVRRIDKVTPQVMIEARVVEANKSFTRALGTEWGMDIGPYFTREFANGVISEGALDFNMTSYNPAASDNSIGISFSKLTGTPFEILDAKLTASESEGLIKIVSAPRILTLDNKTALIKQGLAYPLTKVDADGNTVVEFQDVALELEVTPHVTPDNRISLAIKISNNEIGQVINNETSFTTKEANTELLVNDGDTLVIGGIRKTTKRDNESGWPVLRSVPLLGWLFKETEIEDSLEELLIFITPKIVLLEQR